MNGGKASAPRLSLIPSQPSLLKPNLLRPAADWTEAHVFLGRVTVVDEKLTFATTA